MKWTWAKPDIMEMVGKQIVEGMDDDHFAPDTNVTRAQFATLIAKVLNLKDNAGQTPFDDVASGSWYELAVKKAYAAGLIDGISEHELRTKSCRKTRIFVEFKREKRTLPQNDRMYGEKVI